MSEVKQTLKINNFEVWVNLGCSLEEQKQTQPVHFTLEIKFLKNLNGCRSDQLTEAIDYVQLTQMIKKIATLKPYNLIEHLNYEVFQAIIKILSQQPISAEVQLNIKKIRVPVKNLIDGVEFTCQQMLL